IHLSDNRLKVPLEEPVTKRDCHQSDYCYCECHARDGHDHVTCEHNYYTGKYYELILLCGISKDTAKKGKRINAEIKPAVNTSGLLCGKSEFCLKEEHQDRHHCVKAEPFSHV